MLRQKKLKRILLYLIILQVRAYAQSPFAQLSTTPVECLKGSATLQLSGANSQDTVFVEWSNGPGQVYSLNNLDAGNYSVRIQVLHRLDTTVYFTIAKADCPIGISNQFTPNNDGYHDVLTITNITNYPNFELEIFDRWGQRVYNQKASYTPWDGKWGGFDAPVGTYYFIFFFDAANKNKMLKGDITLLR